MTTLAGHAITEKHWISIHAFFYMYVLICVVFWAKSYIISVYCHIDVTTRKSAMISDLLDKYAKLATITYHSFSLENPYGHV